VGIEHIDKRCFEVQRRLLGRRAPCLPAGLEPFVEQWEHSMNRSKYLAIGAALGAAIGAWLIAPALLTLFRNGEGYSPTMLIPAASQVLVAGAVGAALGWLAYILGGLVQRRRR